MALQFEKWNLEELRANEWEFNRIEELAEDAANQLAVMRLREQSFQTQLDGMITDYARQISMYVMNEGRLKDLVRELQEDKRNHIKRIEVLEGRIIKTIRAANKRNRGQTGLFVRQNELPCNPPAPFQI